MHSYRFFLIGCSAQLPYECGYHYEHVLVVFIAPLQCSACHLLDTESRILDASVDVALQIWLELSLDAGRACCYAEAVQAVI